MTTPPFTFTQRARALLMALAVTFAGLTLTAPAAQATVAASYMSIDCAAPSGLPSTLYIAAGDTVDLVLQGANKCDYVLEASSFGGGGAGIFGASAYAALVGNTPGTGQAIASATVTISLTAVANPSGQVVLDFSRTTPPSFFQIVIEAGGNASSVVVSGDGTPSATISWTGSGRELWLCRSAIQFGSCRLESNALVFGLQPNQTSLTITPLTAALQRDGTGVSVGSTNTYTVILSNGTSAAGSSPFPTVRVMASGGGGGGGMVIVGTAANLAVSGDGTNSLTFTWTGTVTAPLILCNPGLTYAQCVPTGIRFYVTPMALTSPFTLSVGDTVRCFGSMGCSTPLVAGSYSVLIDNNNMSGTNVLQVTFGPGGSSLAPVVDLTPVAPVIVPMAAATFDKPVTPGSTVACVSPEWDKTPTSVTISALIAGEPVGQRILTSAPFRAEFSVPASAAGKKLICELRAALGIGTHTIGIESLIATPGSGSTGTGTTTPVVPVAVPPAPGFGVMSARFDSGSARLSAADQARIAALVTRAGRAGVYRVVGFVQADSLTASGRALAEARAEAVAAELRRRGVPESQIRTSGTRSRLETASARRATVTATWKR